MDMLRRTLVVGLAISLVGFVSGIASPRAARAEPGAQAEGVHPLPPPVVRRVPMGQHDFVRTAAAPSSTALPPPMPPPPPPASQPAPVDAVPVTTANDIVAVPTQGTTNWTTPPEAVPPTWSSPGPVVASPQPPSPPPAPCAPPVAVPAPATAPAVPLSGRCWTGCGLPCEQGISMWHARAVGGIAFYAGKDTPKHCLYWGVDLGRSHCGCWGYDFYYRYSSAQFDRNNDPRLTKDGGYIHHFGGKLTWEHSLGNSRFYGWGGLGAGYFKTEKYLDNDSGFEAFGELGVGYVFTQNVHLRAGVNVHAMDTSVARKNAADDGKSRWLWLIAPVVELEVDF